MSPETPGQVADVLGVLAIAGSLATVIVLAGLGLPSTRLRILTALGGSATVLAGLGLAVNTWHNVIETNPHLAGDSCDPTNPCTLRWVEGLGFWTIPRLATVGFALIIALLTIDHLHTRGATP